MFSCPEDKVVVTSVITEWHIHWIIMIGYGVFLMWKSLFFCPSLGDCMVNLTCTIYTKVALMFTASWSCEKSSEKSQGKTREFRFHEMLGTLYIYIYICTFEKYNLKRYYLTVLCPDLGLHAASLDTMLGDVHSMAASPLQRRIILV